MNENLTPAALDQSALNEVRNLEHEIGKVLVALDPTPAYAALTEEQLDKLRQAEQRLGVVMVAYDT
ncbi:MAG: hypothetical protein DWQ08_06020 [Proteobacteria bacterium]|nr:MAG: hypothetical protein DWQ08_06020 [Pseudomonadota bacterium]